MALNSKNIIVGAARIFVGPAGTNRPAYTNATTRYRTTMAGANGSTSTGGTAVNDWREVGYTTDGLEVATDPTYTDIEADQTMDAVKVFKSGMSMSVSTTMLEATLDNLLMAWGQLASTLSVISANERELAMEGGALGDAPLERGLLAIGNSTETNTAGVYGERFYHFYRVLSVEASTHTLGRTDPTGIPVTFRALPEDVTQRYGVMRDRTPTGGFTA